MLEKLATFIAGKKCQYCGIRGKHPKTAGGKNLHISKYGTVFVREIDIVLEIVRQYRLDKSQQLRDNSNMADIYRPMYRCTLCDVRWVANHDYGREEAQYCVSQWVNSDRPIKSWPMKLHECHDGSLGVARFVGLQRSYK